MEKVASSGTAQVLCHHGCGDAEKETLKYLIFQDRFDILLEKRLSGIAEQEYTGPYGKFRLMTFIKEFRRSGQLFFRWRSFLPLVMIPAFIFFLRNFTYLGNKHSLEVFWEIFCFSVCFLGLGIRVHIVGHKPKGTSGRNVTSQKANTLNTTGIYSIVRHPLYLGNFLIWLSFLLFVRHLFFGSIALLIFFLYYERIIFTEEEFLRKKFGQAFAEWAQKTSMTFPRFKNWQKPDRPFSLKNVLKRENSTFLLIIIAFTSLKVVGDYFYTGNWQISWQYGLMFCFGLVICIVLFSLKKKHLLDVER